MKICIQFIFLLFKIKLFMCFVNGTSQNRANLVAIDPNLIIQKVTMTGNFNQFNLTDCLFKLNLRIECLQTLIIIAINPLKIF